MNIENKNRRKLLSDREFFYIASVLIDSFCIFGSSLGAFFLYFDHLNPPEYYWNAILIAIFVNFTVFANMNIYRSWRGHTQLDQVKSIAVGWTVTLFLLVGMSVMLKVSASYSRIWFGIFTVLGFFSIIISRRFATEIIRRLRSRGWSLRKIVVFGAGGLGRKVVGRVHQANWTGFQVIQFLDDDKAKNGKLIDDIPVITPPENLTEYMLQHRVDEFWIALPLRSEERVASLLHEIRHLTMPVRFIPDIFSFRIFLNHKISEVEGIATINLNSSPMEGFNGVVKAFEDRILSFLILLGVSPVIIIIALLVKLTSRGPVIFKQKRHGWDGTPINVYKFRTMKVHEEKGSQVTQATKDDPRLTPIGKFLRRSSLDELPQFFNVLQGRMSIVGPRPHAIAHNEFYKDQVDYYFQRHQVKPGITGWAQINGWRGETDTLDKMKKRVEYDLYYIQNWSVWFDLKIIILTLFKGFFDRRAY